MSERFATSERFAAARQIDCADVLRLETGQDGVRDGANTKFRCPFHDDHDPSLVTFPAGRGWRCFVCGIGGDAVSFVARLHDVGKVEALERLEAGAFGASHSPAGRSQATRREAPDAPCQTRQRGKVIATYDYQDTNGIPLHRTLRFDPKAFAQQRTDGRGGWINGMGEVEPVLFALPSLIAAPPDTWIYWCEGEKDALRLIALGLIATTQPMGAGTWRESYGQWVDGRNIVLVLDNDAKGKKQGAVVGNGLAGVARTVRVLEFPDLPEKGDVSDYLDAGGTADGLRQMTEQAPSWSDWIHGADEPAASTAQPGRINFLTAQAFAAQTSPVVDWIARPIVAAGAITKLDGAPKKAGKTTLMTFLVAAVLDGKPFLGEPTKRGPVIVLSEQGGTSLREALQRAGLLDRTDLYLALYRDTAGIPWRDVVDEVMKFVDHVGAVLLVVDTLPACSGVRGDDENSSGRAMEALEPLQVGADQRNVGVVVTFHDRKGGGEVGDSGRGSTAYAGAVDIIVHATRPGGNFDPAIRKLDFLSRFDATPDELYIQLTPEGYVALGSEDAVVSVALAHALLKVLPETEAEARRITSIKDKETGDVTEQGLHDELAAVGIKVARSTLDNELKRWVENGYAGRTGEAKRGSPARYWLMSAPPERFFRTKSAGTAEETAATQQQREETVSSDARPPSEETNAAPSEVVESDAFLSSDGPSLRGGRNLFDDRDESTSSSAYLRNGHLSDFIEAEWKEAATV